MLTEGIRKLLKKVKAEHKYPLLQPLGFHFPLQQGEVKFTIGGRHLAFGYNILYFRLNTPNI